MKKVLILAALILTIATIGYTITVNPASAVTADSAATALTIPYRDASGDFAVNTLTAANVTVTGATSIAVKDNAFFNTTVGVVGATYLCSDCTIPYSLCVGTSTALSGWKVTHSASVGCGSND